MIHLAELARVRLARGRVVHAVAPVGSRTTACGLHVHLEDPWGRKQDTALDPTTPVTCPRCRAPEELQP
ncbi:hypothetical protein RVR_8285 [Actinacidiphila reveromycinica]|uniref:Uncharacterized protein n=1 Tax=Actinacidiphila reveromycinica TaxID=659352 RepID=A0A7U3VRQ4_9ACTN|nr:hypothetical protein [Streptomyces sp. SN-593]BBB01050.1 hypothetical protein RVR_8285 [Streptomyces sp. SN-593]